MKNLTLPISKRLTFSSLGFAFACLSAGPAVGQGSIETWGNDVFGHLATEPTGTMFTQIESGTFTSMGLQADGSIVVWGHDGFGVVTNAPTGTGYIQLAMGSEHGSALRADGSIETWGSDAYGQMSNAPIGSGYTQLVADGYWSMALRADGSIAAWGYDAQGQVTGAPAGTGFTQLACSFNIGLALRTDGSIEYWGWDISASAPTDAGYTHLTAAWSSCFALRADGSIVGWGINLDSMISGIPSGTGYQQLSGGYFNALALTGDGTIISWGHVLGDEPVPPLGRGFTQISTGGNVLSALREPGPETAFCFGSSQACPCSNAAGSNAGCSNSGAEGARLRGYGSVALSSDSFGLWLTGVPAGKPVLCFRAANQLGGGSGLPVGSGLLCIGGQAARSQVLFATNGAADFADFGGAAFGLSSFGVGVPTNYQCWYRDPQSACSGGGFNFSNAVSVTWTP